MRTQSTALSSSINKPSPITGNKFALRSDSRDMTTEKSTHAAAFNNARLFYKESDAGSRLAELNAIIAKGNTGEELTGDQKVFYDIYKELVGIDTTGGVGTLKAAKAVEKRLADAGFSPEDIQIFEVGKDEANIVATLRGTGELKPVMGLAHYDVVGADATEWETPPFELTEKQGKFGPEYRGRGAIDDKAMAASLIATLIRLKKQPGGYKGKRDIRVALTTGEEKGGGNGVPWLIKNKPDIFKDVEFAINEGGYGDLDENGKPKSLTLQTGEKIPMYFDMEATGTPSHSAYPPEGSKRANNILAKAITKIDEYEFPIQINETTRDYFTKMRAYEKDEKKLKAIDAFLKGSTDKKKLAPLLEDKTYSSQLSTTVAATKIIVGDTEQEVADYWKVPNNALPQKVRMKVNVRLMPGTKAEDVQKELEKAINDPNVKLTVSFAALESPFSPLDPVIVDSVGKISKRIWGDNFPVIATMSAGATDSRFLRNLGIPTYGLQGLLVGENTGNEHGPNEWGLKKAIHDSDDFIASFLKDISDKSLTVSTKKT
ncbi:MAG: M20/M25/M40 family metallo-hydrolase [Pseudomonadota bacterium]